MAVSENYLLVVWISEGRNFPQRSKHQLLIEAKFDGEILTSNPVEHSNCPDFCIELAWELHRKKLHLHRLQRTPIKLQVFSVDTISKSKEVIGYIILDLRQAQLEKQDVKWYSLLNPKYRNPKPELQVALSLEEDKPLSQLVPTPFTSAEDNKDEKLISSVAKDSAPSTESTSSSLTPSIFQPILNENGGYYQIGPVDECKDDFILSVTIAFAANLEQLIQPSVISQPALQDDFFFYYTLIGNDVTNEKFKSLSNPEFPVERSSVKIKSSLNILRIFFEKQPGIEIHLCCGNVSLGSADVPLHDLVKKNSTEIYMKPLTVEGAFEIKAPDHIHTSLNTTMMDKPIVGVAVILRKVETLVADSKSSEEMLNCKTPPCSPEKESPTTPPQKLERAAGEASSDLINPATSDDRIVSKPNSPDLIDLLSLPDVDQHKDVLPNQSGSSKSSSIASPQFLKRKTVKSPPHLIQHLETDNDLLRTAATHPEFHTAAARPDSGRLSSKSHPLLSKSNHYCITIDLNIFRNLEATSVNCILRYSYPFFGSTTPILTYPPTEVRKNVEVNLPRSFCSFNFATTEDYLQNTFKSSPLDIELWHRDKQLGKDRILGTASLPLFNVLSKGKKQFSNENGSGFRQIYQDRIPFLDINNNQRQIATLSFVVGLDDLGPVQEGHLLEIPLNSTTEKQETVTVKQPVPIPFPNRAVSQISSGPRDSIEYQAAMELELWKATQQELFQKKLKEKEQQYLKMLAEEWKRRDTERELLYQNRNKEYQELEDKLRDTLIDIEKRERQLRINELEVTHMREDLKRKHDSSVKELQETLRRVQEECRHQIDLEHLRVNEIEEQKRRLQNQLLEMEEKLQAKDKEFENFKQQLHTKPEIRLQSEIHVLTLEKADLEKKLEAVIRSRLHYKQQWIRASKELDHRKQKEQAEARIRLKKQEEELEQMRLRYLAAEEKEVMKNERNTLDDIKKELNRIREQCTSENHSAKIISLDKDSSALGVTSFRDDILEADLNSYISRLQDEQDALLRTGVYTSEDRIIIELERQIREAITKRESLVTR